MPYCKIPASKINHLPLFGYNILDQDDSFIYADGPDGKVIIDKSSPWIWFEDEVDAHQLGVQAIITKQALPRN